MHNATDEELETTYAPLDRAIVAYGHIHLPFVREVGNRVVANCGSAGMPFDGDPRASYLVVDEGIASIRRVAYDVETRSNQPVAIRLP